MNVICENYVKTIEGELLLKIGRVADMAWLSIGKLKKVKDHKGVPVEKSTYAIHIQCPWRMVDSNSKTIIFTAYDMYLPNETNMEKKFNWNEAFEWDIQGENSYDEKVSRWLSENNNVYINKISMTPFGDLKIELSNHYDIEVFVNRSSWNECWRFFEPYAKKKHLVVYGNEMLYE